jgi:hypothetical protein
MRIRILLAALGAVWFAGAAAAADPAGKINLRVLYAGRPGDARTTEFVAFLGQHFVKVGEASYSAFEPTMADGYDVVLFDAARERKANSLGLPPKPKLPPDYNRASVLIGGAGVMAVMPLQSKLDWL